MYSNKENVNQLTALLVAHGVRHAVVCPGSRNAPIVHNLNECPDVACYPVTDERSAGFYALGMMQALDEPVAVCVTSGTALLNLMPAVAEAWYQHQPLIVISADRPQQWIDQLDGQTLPQPGTLGRFVRRTVSLPEDDAWYCNRLVNEALLDAMSDDARPVHINVPITEPLFTFDVPQLPQVRRIVRTSPTRDYDCISSELVEAMASAERPMIVFGQTNPHRFEGSGVDFLFSHVIVLHEALSSFPSVSHFDEVLYREELRVRSEELGVRSEGVGVRSEELGVRSEGVGVRSEERLLPPDVIVYVGDTIVSKRLRRFLRSASDAATWRISQSGDVEDTFQNLRGIIVGDPEFVLQTLSRKLSFRHLHGRDYRRQWLAALQRAARHAEAYQPAYSQMAAVKYFEALVSIHNSQLSIHNSQLSIHNSQLSIHNSQCIMHNCQPSAFPVQPSTSNIRRSPFPVQCSPFNVQCSPSTVQCSTFTVHYANSSAIRLANIFARHHVWCNRGVNGIEGSLSTAAGYSLTSHLSPLPSKTTSLPSETTPLPSETVFCVIGDLSFFYDQNALWNQNLGGNLRILLLNNGRGGIFNMLPGLDSSPARDRLVAAAHSTSAEGICHDNHVVYHQASDMEQMQQAIDTLIHIDSDHPVLLEVFTDAAEDERVLKDYYLTMD